MSSAAGGNRTNLCVATCTAFTCVHACMRARRAQSRVLRAECRATCATFAIKAAARASPCFHPRAPGCGSIPENCLDGSFPTVRSMYPMHAPNSRQTCGKGHHTCVMHAACMQLSCSTCAAYTQHPCAMHMPHTVRVYMQHPRSTLADMQHTLPYNVCAAYMLHHTCSIHSPHMQHARSTDAANMQHVHYMQHT